MGEENEVLVNSEPTEPTPGPTPEPEPEPESVDIIGPRGEGIPLDCFAKEF